jgi:hypothetical protein
LLGFDINELDQNAKFIFGDSRGIKTIAEVKGKKSCPLCRCFIVCSRRL